VDKGEMKPIKVEFLGMELRDRRKGANPVQPALNGEKRWIY